MYLKRLILLISNPWWGLSTPSPWWLAFFQVGATEMDHTWILCGLLVRENGHIFVHACVHAYDPTTPSQYHTHQSTMNRYSHIWHWCWIEEPKNSNSKTIKLRGPYIKGLWQFNGVDCFPVPKTRPQWDLSITTHHDSHDSLSHLIASPSEREALVGFCFLGIRAYWNFEIFIMLSYVYAIYADLWLWYQSGHSILWITDFPMFEWNSSDERLEVSFMSFVF